MTYLQHCYIQQRLIPIFSIDPAPNAVKSWTAVLLCAQLPSLTDSHYTLLSCATLSPLPLYLTLLVGEKILKIISVLSLMFKQQDDCRV